LIVFKGLQPGKFSPSRERPPPDGAHLGREKAGAGIGDRRCASRRELQPESVVSKTLALPSRLEGFVGARLKKREYKSLSRSQLDRMRAADFLSRVRETKIWTGRKFGGRPPNKFRCRPKFFAFRLVENNSACMGNLVWIAERDMQTP
jgi:hypothetical protein